MKSGIIKLNQKRSYTFISDKDPNETKEYSHFFVSNEDVDYLEKIFYIEEMEMFKEMRIAQDFGLCILVLAGLRSLLESLINRVCEMKNIKITFINPRGREEKIPLFSRYWKIWKFLEDSYSKQVMRDIIEKANESLHELKKKLTRKDTAMFICNLIIILKNEIIFNQLIKKNEPTATTSSDQSI